MAVRRALFEAGLAAFERQPIGLVSILDITEAADVAKGVFYLQFKSKDDYLLALWQETQGRFLEAVRTALVSCRSHSARINAAVPEFASFAKSAPAAARFWVRMSSYFADEIGEPGHLARIRQEYIEQLAALIARKPVAALTSHDLHVALVVDTVCWAVAGAEVRKGAPVLDAEKLVKAVRAALAASKANRDR